MKFWSGGPQTVFWVPRGLLSLTRGTIYVSSDGQRETDREREESARQRNTLCAWLWLFILQVSWASSVCPVQSVPWPPGRGSAAVCRTVSPGVRLSWGQELEPLEEYRYTELQYFSTFTIEVPIAFPTGQFNTNVKTIDINCTDLDCLIEKFPLICQWYVHHAH